MRIFKLTEHNDWEGETWNFYFKATDEQCSELAAVLKDTPEDTYEFSIDEFTLEEVIELEKNDESCKFSPSDDDEEDEYYGNTYLPEQNFLGRLIKTPRHIDEIYKGGIQDFCQMEKW